jgi:hypothetical protein
MRAYELEVVGVGHRVDIHLKRRDGDPLSRRGSIHLLPIG